MTASSGDFIFILLSLHAFDVHAMWPYGHGQPDLHLVLVKAATKQYFLNDLHASP